jgi:hypothetical protein
MNQDTSTHPSDCACALCQGAGASRQVPMLSRPQLAHRFALRKAHELIDREEQQTGDASDGCGESPDGSDE